MVMSSWFINSTMNEVGENFLLFGLAEEIGDAEKETYSKIDNSSELLAVESMLHDLLQGDLSLTQYYNTLIKKWQQIHMFEGHQWNCPDVQIDCGKEEALQVFAWTQQKTP